MMGARRRYRSSVALPMSAAALSAPPPSPEEELDRLLAVQAPGVARHTLADGRTVWVRKAGPRHGRWRYWLMGVVSDLLRLDVLAPIPNLGGQAAIATEARRLRALHGAGLGVPHLLAVRADGLMMSDLSGGAATARSLGDALASANCADAALVLWRSGLEAISAVHAQGTYLSQAFARNLVLQADGRVGFIDFEDDPGQSLDLPHCQARDWLGYLHSTALTLRSAGAFDEAAAHWRACIAAQSEPVQTVVRHSARRMAWLQRLPEDRRWGRDLQRLQAAAALLNRAV
jgi:tRNA A-37 threonylcarbamoyl transferase component Bud32